MAKSKNRGRSPQQNGNESEGGDRDQRTPGSNSEGERRRPQASPADMARKQQKRFGHN